MRNYTQPEFSAASKDTCRYCGVAGHWARDCRKKKREEAHLVRAEGAEAHLVRGGDDEDDSALLMMDTCTIATSPQLPASTRQAESSTSEAAPLSRPVAESATRPVAESEGLSTPPEELAMIRWIAEWDVVTREESAVSGREDPTESSSQEDSTALAQKELTMATREELATRQIGRAHV